MKKMRYSPCSQQASLAEDRVHNGSVKIIVFNLELVVRFPMNGKWKIILQKRIIHLDIHSEHQAA